MIWTKKAWYRIFQFVFYKGAYLLKWRKPLLLTGAGCHLKLPNIIKSMAIDHVLIVTDSRLMDLHLPDRLLTVLHEKQIKYTIFDGICFNPTIDIIEETRGIYIKNNCQGFIAFGGGSVIDTAKIAAARITQPNKTIIQMRGFFKVWKKLPPIFAIPTTTGSGSEVTIAAVVIDSKTHHKFAINDLQLIPVCAALDPELAISLSPENTAETGMDALTHAVESYLTLGASKHCRELSETAARMIFMNIEKGYQSGSDLESRQNMLLASFYAGVSFSRAGLTYVHPIAHTLGGLYNQAHGRANAIILPYVLDAYGSSIHKKLARLASVVGLDVSDKTQNEAANAFIASIRLLNRHMNIPEKFDCINKEDIPQIIRWALAEANPWYSVPKIFGQIELEAVIDHMMI